MTFALPQWITTIRLFDFSITIRYDLNIYVFFRRIHYIHLVLNNYFPIGYIVDKIFLLLNMSSK